VKRWQWIILALLAYLILLLVYMPARYVTSYVQESTQNQLRFTGVAGTLFSGTSQSLSYEGLRVTNIKWDLSPLSLLWLQASLDIRGGAIRNSEQIYIDGNINLSILNPAQVNLSSARIFAPAKLLLSQVNLPVAVTALGRFRLDIANFKFNEGCQQLNGQGSWLQAGVNIEGSPLDLGSFDALLSCESPAFVLDVSPENGLALDAKISFDQNGNYAAVGTFSIPSDFPNDIRQGASFFGESLGQGRYALDIKSR
jgi:general secretion pathway protein N